MSAQSIPDAKLIKVFLAAPSDVREERSELADLVREVNDVLAFLAPEKRLQLELVQYETHAFPDVGEPQEVINRQIPLDYDIFVGIMWRRCGTPTREYASGTIEEFWRAYKHRQQHNWPTVMFYFCDESIPIPNGEELKQLEGVVNFREQVAPFGYTINYPVRSDFRKYVRGGLLRAVRSVLQLEHSSVVPSSTAALEPVPVESGVRTSFLTLASEYEALRSTLKSGTTRTRRMTELFSRMTALAGSARGLFSELQVSTSPGQRLAAISILHMFPSAQHLNWLAERLDPEEEKPFVGYQAANGLLQAVRALPNTDCSALFTALHRARELAERLTTDPPRIQVLEIAHKELSAKCKDNTRRVDDACGEPAAPRQKSVSRRPVHAPK